VRRVTIQGVPPKTPWIQVSYSRPAARLRLYCFPYAGSGAGVFRSWSDGLDQRIEVRAIVPPGRERRFVEPALDAVTVMADGLLPALLPALDPPFALFGHSLGAMLAYETARRLTAAGQAPVHLMVSASRAPHHPKDGIQYHRLPDAEFLPAVSGLGGTPPELTESAELVELMLPTLRADFTAAETYSQEPDPPLPCPITAFAGSDDPVVSGAGVQAWAAHSGAGFRAHVLPGDHFFIATARSALLELIEGELTPHLAAA
jgi:medium-chain acyl-[acyl-carrier-protein] hydrolase